jgi:hypothetical protein
MRRYIKRSTPGGGDRGIEYASAAVDLNEW